MKISISIHALLAESDAALSGGTLSDVDFYPRSPCGERPIFAVRPYDAPIFLSTLSLRRATLFLRCGPMTRRYFYPRSPCGERHTPYALESWPDSISIHALLAESDDVYKEANFPGFAFLSTLSLRRATLNSS